MKLRIALFLILFNSFLLQAQEFIVVMSEDKLPLEAVIVGESGKVAFTNEEGRIELDKVKFPIILNARNFKTQQLDHIDGMTDTIFMEALADDLAEVQVAGTLVSPEQALSRIFKNTISSFDLPRDAFQRFTHFVLNPSGDTVIFADGLVVTRFDNGWVEKPSYFYDTIFNYRIVTDSADILGSTRLMVPWLLAMSNNYVYYSDYLVEEIFEDVNVSLDTLHCSKNCIASYTWKNQLESLFSKEGNSIEVVQAEGEALSKMHIKSLSRTLINAYGRGDSISIHYDFSPTHSFFDSIFVALYHREGEFSGYENHLILQAAGKPEAAIAQEKTPVKTPVLYLSMKAAMRVLARKEKLDKLFRSKE